MNGREKSDLAIVAEKLANEAERSASESMEPRAGAEGNASQQSAFRPQCRANASQALERIRQAARYNGPSDALSSDPRWEPYAGIPLVRFCAGGAQQ
jgi:hypothetical protein